MKTKFILLIITCMFMGLQAKSQNPTQKLLKGIMGKKKVSSNSLPDSYTFNWEFKTEIKSAKNETMELNYLINSSVEDFFGMAMSGEKLKGGKATIVFDTKNDVFTMFMNMQGQKMAQIRTLPSTGQDSNEADFKFKEIGTKEILGYTCYGIEVENPTHIGTMYFTLDAPINFSAFFAMSNNKNMPKGFDPALLQVLKEDALLMEMSVAHKKKKKESYTMVAKSLEEKDAVIQKADYQFMNFGF